MLDHASGSSTHSEYVGDGFSVRIQHCEVPGCDAYLGVNYPSDRCASHRRSVATEQTPPS